MDGSHYYCPANLLRLLFPLSPTAVAAAAKVMIVTGTAELRFVDCCVSLLCREIWEYRPGSSDEKTERTRRFLFVYGAGGYQISVFPISVDVVSPFSSTVRLFGCSAPPARRTQISDRSALRTTTSLLHSLHTLSLLSRHLFPLAPFPLSTQRQAINQR